MGQYAEYLDKRLPFQEIVNERKKVLKKISELRGGRDILTIAADLNNNQNSKISLNYEDLLPIKDQLDNLAGKSIDLIIETPGGSGEVTEHIVRVIRKKYRDGEVGVIVPGFAKSAGTILAMSADEILMGPISALGPIDAQMMWNGKMFSADALITGFDKIKKEIDDSGVLSKAYIPILQGISPGEIQNAKNSMDFARRLVSEWLVMYKFKNWTTHKSTGIEVTDDEKISVAERIASDLCDHNKWLTHGRSIQIKDLREMGLLIEDYSENPELADKIDRYYALLQMLFEAGFYKIYETPDSQIYKVTRPQVQTAIPSGKMENHGELEIKCRKCNRDSNIQVDFKKGVPLREGFHRFPKDDNFTCPGCGTELDLSQARHQIEQQTKQKVIREGEGSWKPGSGSSSKSSKRPRKKKGRR